MNPEKNDRKLTRWLLAATIALLVLVLGLQLWQLFGRKNHGYNGSLVPDSALGPAAPAAGVSPGKAAMIEEVRTLNAGLSAGDLEKLSNEELEQLWRTGAPGLPIGVSSAARAAEEYAGTLEADSVTSETDPELDEAPPHYEVELHHPTLGDFTYKIGAYTGEVLEGTSNIMRLAPNASAPQEVPATLQTPGSAVQDPPSETQKPAPEAQTSAPGTAAPGGEEAAQSAAFAHAGVSASDASGVRCKLDWKEGRQVYDVEFWVGDTEYGYKIDAATSAVLEAEQELNGHHAGTSARQDSGLIGEEAAQNAAFAHAGVSGASLLKCELDEDGGRWVYELEFQVGGVEYGYEVDAASGTVIKAELDR